MPKKSTKSTDPSLAFKQWQEMERLARLNGKKAPLMYDPKNGQPMEHPIFVTAREEAIIRKILGHNGKMTPYGVRSYTDPSQSYGGDLSGTQTSSNYNGSGTPSGSNGDYSGSYASSDNGSSGGSISQAAQSIANSINNNTGGSVGGGHATSSISQAAQAVVDSLSGTGGHATQTDNSVMSALSSGMFGGFGKDQSRILSSPAPNTTNINPIDAAALRISSGVNSLNATQQVAGVEAGAPISQNLSGITAISGAPGQGAISKAATSPFADSMAQMGQSPTPGMGMPSMGLTDTGILYSDPRAGYYDKNGANQTTQFADRLREELQLNGLTPNDTKVSAVMGSLLNENLPAYLGPGSDQWSLDNKAGSFTPVGTNPDVGFTAGGAAEWHGSRLNAVNGMFGQDGLNPNDPNSQAAAVAWETANYPDLEKVYNTLNSSSIPAATQQWMRGYENPSYVDSVNHIVDRKASANQFAQNFPSGQPAPDMVALNDAPPTVFPASSSPESQSGIMAVPSNRQLGFISTASAPSMGVPDISGYRLPDITGKDVPNQNVPSSEHVGSPAADYSLPNITGTKLAPDTSAYRLPDISGVSNYPATSPYRLPDATGTSLTKPPQPDTGANQDAPISTPQGDTGTNQPAPLVTEPTGILGSITGQEAADLAAQHNLYPGTPSVQLDKNAVPVPAPMIKMDPNYSIFGYNVPSMIVKAVQDPSSVTDPKAKAALKQGIAAGLKVVTDPSTGQQIVEAPAAALSKLGSLLTTAAGSSAGMLKPIAQITQPVNSKAVSAALSANANIKTDNASIDRQNASVMAAYNDSLNSINQSIAAISPASSSADYSLPDITGTSYAPVASAYRLPDMTGGPAPNQNMVGSGYVTAKSSVKAPQGDTGANQAPPTTAAPYSVPDIHYASSVKTPQPDTGANQSAPSVSDGLDQLEALKRDMLAVPTNKKASAANFPNGIPSTLNEAENRPISDMVAPDVVSPAFRGIDTNFRIVPEQNLPTKASKVKSAVIKGATNLAIGQVPVVGAVNGLGGLFGYSGGDAAVYQYNKDANQAYPSENAPIDTNYGVGGGHGTTGSPASVAAQPATTSDTTSQPMDRYYWDIGFNVPNPGDAKYQSYLDYLKTRVVPPRKAA